MNGMPLLTRLRTRGMRRTGGLLLALPFMLVASGDVFNRHHCAHHDGPDPASTHASAAHTHAGAEETHASAGAGRESHDPADGSCTCIGTCHGSATTPLPPSPLASVAASPAPNAVVDPRPVVSRAVRLLPHVLPFANGPPARG